MAAAARPIPQDFHSITTHMIVKDVDRAIDFYERALGANELSRMVAPDGKTVMHAELKIGDTIFMMGSEMPGGHCKSAQTLGGSSVSFYLYVNDVDQSFKKAVDAGGKQTEAVTDMFWGDRCGAFLDPFGQQWSVATRKEDLSAEEIERRAKEFFSKKKVA